MSVGLLELTTVTTQLDINILHSCGCTTVHLQRDARASFTCGKERHVLCDHKAMVALESALHKSHIPGSKVWCKGAHRAAVDGCRAWGTELPCGVDHQDGIACTAAQCSQLG